jgi:N6-adenosine-specific RNA methylase IME4
VGGRRRNPTVLGYPVVTLDDIASFPVGDLAEEDAHLFLWVTPALNRKGAGVRVAEAWGFRVVSEVIWEKPNLGMGAFPRACHEPLLVCSRGALPWTGSRGVRSVQRWGQPRLERNGGKWHSQKPPAVYGFIEAASPGPYLEVFARQSALGWVILGEDFVAASPHPIPPPGEET